MESSTDKVTLDTKNVGEASAGTGDLADYMAIGGLVMAIIGILSFCCVGFLSIAILIIPIAAYYWGRESRQYRNLALMGAIIGGVGVVLNIILVICFLGIIGLATIASATVYN